MVGYIFHIKNCKEINLIFFKRKIDLSFETDNYLINAKIFNQFIINNKYDLQKIEILTGIIFLNMSPMHHAPFSHYVYYLGKKQLSKWISNSKFIKL